MVHIWGAHLLKRNWTCKLQATWEQQSWCLIMQINFFSSESQKGLRGGCFPWHGDNVTWKAWLQEPLKFPNWRPGRKDHDEKAVYALSVGQAKPRLLILVQRNTFILFSHVSEGLRNPQTKPKVGKQRRKVRQSKESHRLVVAGFSRQDGKSTNQDQRGRKPNGVCYNQFLLLAFGEYFGRADKLLGLQKPQLLISQDLLHLWGQEVWDLPTRKISKLLHTLCAH